MKFGAEVKLSMPLSKLQDEVPGRIENVRRIVGREIAEKITHEVTRRIPSSGGWYKIYRDALAYKETSEGDQWAIAGFTKIELSDPPADTTLVDFAGIEPDGRALAGYNPWPIDMIPVVVGGYKDGANIYPAGEGAVTSNRERVRAILDVARQALIDDAQASLADDSGQLEIQGDKVVDLAFLASRMEVGYGGFPRHPHWGPAVSKTRSNAL